ncbi:MAG: ribosomal RNA small subunit methyltransferase A [Proteobacteria bacterium]|jgi:16S rRNA (adenine1518-N6/adenine1519-N6)-dimethyltransferase|nr:ribosomal RNA small subunit methyltransferase A [Desulfocapsa sp.]MBU3946043.1 ribosomal RNA small subunit methyltransferase A [Pseudomonadota bacterium]MCG2742877.1 16S rRNA (adenine(1518)-N(6)/adenine(1519)-N(6))-dimethyltransferase RsmA [Desulfobacteraceae bacterium]MBU3984149.1 ribosomal RNA small subunit methyltransferase A [Pseudomonadota bacterium]MBU4030192.1 ribosomal RNA small subunit methyltransferase A [Pseudomonadota bacterium]
MTAAHNTRSSLEKHHLTPKKRFGQNFLVHAGTAEAIVRAGRITTEEIILEVGVGLGALTRPLALTAKQVIGLEIDSGIIRFHQEEEDLPENVTLIHQDVLKADFHELSELCQGPIKIMANLPYSISNPFLFKLIENKEKMAWATIMLQKEVADRLTAQPGSKQYGVPTVLLSACATVKKLMTLKPAEFHPRPKIDSVVVRIDFDRQDERIRALPVYDYSLLQRVVRGAFSQRRKTLLNTLSSTNILPMVPEQEKATVKQLTEAAIRKAGIAPSARAEDLTLEDFVQLTLAFAG